MSDGKGSSGKAGPKIAPTKLQAFTVGIHKKTPFQKQKEAEEARRKREEEESARVYADFVASFDQDTSKPKTWVKGSTLVPTVIYDREEADRREEAANSVYRPQQRFVPSSGSSQDGYRRHQGYDEQPPHRRRDEPERDESRPVGKTGRKRNLDMFLEELKREQEERDQRLKSKHARMGDRDSQPEGLTLRAAFEENPGSHDTGDPDTTNLYVGNISPDVDEDMLCRAFAVHGPIASVKIMWPRTQEERERKRNCGFVSFMTREAAQNALKSLDGFDLLGYVMRVGWGKAVAIPPKPIFVLEGAPLPPVSGLPFNAQRSTSKVPGGLVAATNPGTGAAGSDASSTEVCVVIPSDPEVLAVIHRTIERVLKHGPDFEALIMDREKNNSKFGFLYDHVSPAHIYYRWKLFSMLHGDPKDRWSTQPFCMFADGPLWVPPDIPFNDEDGTGDTSSSEDSSSSDSEVDVPVRRPVSSRGTLLRPERLRFERKLRKLNLDRLAIGELMVFCMDHSDAAEEIVDTISRSLLLAKTPIFPTKMARLYLVSDILHNSSVSIPNAWKYRTYLEKRLGDVFGHLGTVWKGISGRLRREQMRRAVFDALGVWEGWNVFSKDFTEGLKVRFQDAKVDERKEEEGKGKETETEVGGDQARVGGEQERHVGGEEQQRGGGESDEGDVERVPLPSALPQANAHPQSSGVSLGGSAQEDNDGPAPMDEDGDESGDDGDVDGVPLPLPATVSGVSSRVLSPVPPRRDEDVEMRDVRQKSQASANGDEEEDIDDIFA
ncbi:U2 snRNP-associated SURP domain-containing protein [Rhizophlyctis rosea]|nr:U2 snRNP-associated SURP domain-containing protein [Rhizophlyctis rosea]